ncbi:IS3 family transposase [Mammaliicoccus stepanovicii]
MQTYNKIRIQQKLGYLFPMKFRK